MSQPHKLPVNPDINQANTQDQVKLAPNAQAPTAERIEFTEEDFKELGAVAVKATQIANARMTRS